MADNALPLVPPLAGDPRFTTLAAVAQQRLAAIDLTALLVYLTDLTAVSALPWLAGQFSLPDDGWEMAESDEAKRAMIKSAIELHRYKGTPWSIREVIRRLELGEVDLLEGTGRITYDGQVNYNGYYRHGDPEAWSVWRIILRKPVTRDQAEKLRSVLAGYAPARCHLASLEYQAAPARYNGSVSHDGNYHYGSINYG